MNKVKFLGLACLVLLIVNLLLTCLIWQKPNRLRPEPKKVIIEQLQLNDKQVADYDELIKWHRQNIRKNESKIRDLKNELYASLKNGSKATNSDSIINEISLVQKEIEGVHLKHFTDIKNLCRPHQKQAFNELCDGIAGLFSPPRPHKADEER